MFSQIDPQELRNFLASSSKYQAMRNIDPRLFNHSEVGFRLLNSFLYEVGNFIASTSPDNNPCMTAKNYFQVFFEQFWQLLAIFNKLHDDGVKIFDGKNTHSMRSYVRCTAQRRLLSLVKSTINLFCPPNKKTCGICCRPITFSR